MTNTQNALIEKITCDREVIDAYTDPQNIYHAIVRHQIGSTRKQVPEPFNGNVLKAKILLIGSNPSISETEIYPDYTWTIRQIICFFIHRFDKYADHYTRYWDYAVKFSSWISECLNWNIPFLKHKDGFLYRDLYPYVAITELVHCKSKHEEGVKECLHYSYDKWMKQILSLFTGEVVVLVGRKVWKFEDDIRNTLISLGKSKVKIVIVEHPSYYAKGLNDIKRMNDLKSQLVTK